MKIITVLNNYHTPSGSSSGLFSAEHPEWVFLPDSSMIRSGNPFLTPDLEDLFQGAVSNKCVAFPSVALKIGKLGKSIESRFGNRYLTQGALCMNFIAADILDQRKASGSPWTEAMAFDRSFVCSVFIPFESSRLRELSVVCTLSHPGGSSETLEWRGDNMLLSAEEMLSRISRMNTMKMGDILIPAVPSEGIQVNRGDTLTMQSAPFAELLVNIK